MQLDRDTKDIDLEIDNQNRIEASRIIYEKKSVVGSKSCLSYEFNLCTVTFR